MMIPERQAECMDVLKLPTKQEQVGSYVARVRGTYEFLEVGLPSWLPGMSEGITRPHERRGRAADVPESTHVVWPLRRR